MMDYNDERERLRARTALDFAKADLARARAERFRWLTRSDTRFEFYDRLRALGIDYRPNDDDLRRIWAVATSVPSPEAEQLVMDWLRLRAIVDARDFLVAVPPPIAPADVDDQENGVLSAP